MSLSTYFHTMRHLRPVQVYGRIWYRLYQPRPAERPAPPVREPGDKWQTPARREPSMRGPARFWFLGEERELAWPEGWNRPDIHKLWLYNLHYFDDLSARGADERRAWHTDLIDRWIRENPPFAGQGWEPYPLSVRIVNWIKWLLAGGPATARLRESLAHQVRYLSRRLEHHLLGNHLLTNAKALCFAGLYFSGPEADRWLDNGLRLVARELPEQILPDGGHFELSPMYHSLVLEDLLDLQNLFRVYSAVLPPRAMPVRARVLAAAMQMRPWLQAMCLPDGQITLFSDAAHGIAPTPDELEDYAARVGWPPPAAFDEHLQVLPESGYVRVAAGPAVAVLDVGEIGPAYLPGHGHADVFTFELALAGRRLVVDSGTSVYYGNDTARQQQRSTAAHNTVVVDGADSSEVWGNFRVARRAHPHDVEARDEGAAGLVVSAWHDGYLRLPGRVRHHRVWRLTDTALVIDDRLDGTFREAQAWLHLHPEVEVEHDSPGGPIRLRQSGREVRFSATGGAAEVVASEYHPHFGVTLPSHALRVRFSEARLICRLEWSP